MHFTAYDACSDLSKVHTATPAPVSEPLAFVIALVCLVWIAAIPALAVSYARVLEQL